MLNASSYSDNFITPLEFEETPKLWKTWLFGLTIITAASFLSPAAILTVPLLQETLYERIMIFLVALGIGAMSGSCIFILIPQAFDITEVAKIDYVTKSWLMISALYTFFAVDRILQCVIEFRRRRQSRRKIHAATLKAIFRQCNPKLKRSLDTTNDIKENGQLTKYHDIIKKSESSTDNNRKRESVLSVKPICHSLIIDENANVIMMNTDKSTNVRKSKRNKNAENENHSHNPIPFSKKNVESARRVINECHDLENDLEIAMVNNVLTRTLSTRRSIATIKRSAPDVVQIESSDGIVHVLPNGIEAQKNNNLEKTTKQRQRQKDQEIDIEMKIHEAVVIEKAKLEVANVAYMIIFGSSANNFVDGMSTGAAFSDSIVRGLTIGFAVLSQQFPQELGTLAILAKSGLGIRRALIFNMLPISLSYVGFAFGVFLDNVNDSYDSFIFAISAGMYFYIFLGTLIPEIRQTFRDTLQRDIYEAFLTTILQFSGITFGICFLYLMS